MINGTTAVSYTHLDVYKRQPIDWRCQINKIYKKQTKKFKITSKTSLSTTERSLNTTQIPLGPVTTRNVKISEDQELKLPLHPGTPTPNFY